MSGRSRVLHVLNLGAGGLSALSRRSGNLWRDGHAMARREAEVSP
jgi:hypothetical protein